MNCRIAPTLAEVYPVFMIGWENPLGILGDAARTAAGRFCGFVFACWFGFALAFFCAHHLGAGNWLTTPLATPLAIPLAIPLLIPIYWLVGIGLGLAAGTGFIAYFILFALLITLIRSDQGALRLYVAAAVVQACESAWLLARLGSVHWVWFALLLSTFLAGYATLAYRYRRATRTRSQGRRRRLSGLCDQCGYDLRGSVAARSEFCPECGHPIADTTIRIIHNREA